MDAEALPEGGVLKGYLGLLVAWVEPGLVLVGLCVRPREATARLGTVPARFRRRAANQRRAA